MSSSYFDMLRIASYVPHLTEPLSVSARTVKCPVLFFSLGAFAMAANVECLHAMQSEQPSVKGPVVHEPVKPAESSLPVEELPHAPEWKPGDPVRVRPDLRQDPNQTPQPPKKPDE
jgi:hypothetical protein